MRRLPARRAATMALLVIALGVPAALAEPLLPGEAAAGWSPSFTFLAGEAARERRAEKPRGAPVAANVSPSPGCSEALADTCLAPVAPAGSVDATAAVVAASVSASASDAASSGPSADAAAQDESVVVTQAQDDDAVAQASPPRTVEPAELPRRDETERWVPSLSFFGAALIQDADSSAASRPLYDPLGANSQVPTIRNGRSIQEEICLNGDLDCVRTTASGNDRQVTPLVSASLELMSPGVQSWPGRPRAFVHADAGVSFSRTRNIAREGVPGELQIPPILGGGGSVSPPNVIGQGSTTASWVKTLVLNGGLGVAFTADVGERRLRIKPSVEYLREKVRVDGVVKRVAALAPSADPRRTAECSGATLDGCRTIELSGSDEKPFHGVGPGLELEMDAARAGPIVFSVYTAGAAYRMLGDLDITFSDTQLADPDNPDSAETAVWNYEKNPWSYRVGVGLRFRFVPED